MKVLKSNNITMAVLQVNDCTKSETEILSIQLK